MAGNLWLTYRRSVIHYHRFGNGPEWLFCFHGYGEDGSTFSVLESLLGEKYTLIAFDMPFHGQTRWEEGKEFMPDQLVELMEMLVPANVPVSLCGFSMGGRVSLQLLQQIPDRIRRVVLAAPDGLHKNPWQRFATQNRLGNRLFGYVMRQPGWFFKVIDLAGWLKLYHKSLVKFVHYYLDDAEQRKLLYQRWTAMRYFNPDPQLVKKNAEIRRIPVWLFFGLFDKVIVASHGHRFAEGAESLIHVKELTAGHQLLREKYASVIAAPLLND